MSIDGVGSIDSIRKKPGPGRVGNSIKRPVAGSGPGGMEIGGVNGQQTRVKGDSLQYINSKELINNQIKVTKEEVFNYLLNKFINLVKVKDKDNNNNQGNTPELPLHKSPKAMPTEQQKNFTSRDSAISPNCVKKKRPLNYQQLYKEYQKKDIIPDRKEQIEEIFTAKLFAENKPLDSIEHQHAEIALKYLKKQMLKTVNMIIKNTGLELPIVMKLLYEISSDKGKITEYQNNAEENEGKVDIHIFKNKGFATCAANNYATIVNLDKKKIVNKAIEFEKISKVNDEWLRLQNLFTDFFGDPIFVNQTKGYTTFNLNQIFKKVLEEMNKGEKIAKNLDHDKNNKRSQNILETYTNWGIEEFFRSKIIGIGKIC